jgi:hypothetical protein
LNYELDNYKYQISGRLVFGIKKWKRPKAGKVWKKLDKFAHEMALMNPGMSLSEKLIEMRYEQ